MRAIVAMKVDSTDIPIVCPNCGNVVETVKQEQVDELGHYPDANAHALCESCWHEVMYPEDLKEYKMDPLPAPESAPENVPEPEEVQDEIR